MSKNKVEHTHPTGLLHPLHIPVQKWESISMDFITGLPKVFGKDCIFVVVDWLTKFDHLFVVTGTFTAAQVAKLFFKEVFRLHGLPKSIVSDRDSIFLSAFWQELSKSCGNIWHLAQDIIHKIMAKQRGWINVWKDTWGTMLVDIKKHG